MISGTPSTTGTFILLVHDYNHNWGASYDATLTKVLGPQAPDADSGELTRGATRSPAFPSPKEFAQFIGKEMRLLRSLDEAIRDTDAGQGVSIDDVRKRVGSWAAK